MSVLELNVLCVRELNVCVCARAKCAVCARAKCAVCLQSQVTNTSSQDSIQEGLSPDMSDHDHSNEIDNDPREIHIPKTSSSLGEGVCVCV